MHKSFKCLASDSDCVCVGLVMLAFMLTFQLYEKNVNEGAVRAHLEKLFAK